MKRKIFGATLLVVLAVAAGWNFNQSKNEIKLNELAVTNVEALAANEVDNIKCNSAIDDTCILVNNVPIKGEKY